MSDTYRVIGMMSGTSIDGLDICLVNFAVQNQNWKFEIEQATTLPYTAEFKTKLSYKPDLSARDLEQLDHEYGLWLGEQVKLFLNQHQLEASEIDLIASHGHTLFHQPENGYTKQIGCGPEITKTSGIMCVTDFRSPDIVLGGQGAPLVPIGDQLLFSQYDACLNLGGFANISFHKNGNRLAFDICPVNFILNHLSSKLGYEYDKNGALAESGNLISEVLEKLNALPFYKMQPPKSLGAEWVNQQVFPILDNLTKEEPNLLRTAVEHASMQIASTLDSYNINTCLITGGGVFNQFLIRRIKELSNTKVIIPTETVINFKEALIFALLGVLRTRGEVNVLSSVTGASRDHSSGLIYSV